MNKAHVQKSKPIKSWQKFAKNVRAQGCHLLTKLDDFSNPVLVSGCQRSGGTMLTNIISKSQGMVDFSQSKDDELDGALILSGYREQTIKGRYCFQTTYLNECYLEYFQHDQQYKLIWLIRNPYSVVYSLLHNWERFALNELFLGCGVDTLSSKDVKWFNRFGLLAISRLTRACLSYNNKISQIYKIRERLENDSVIIVDYDDLVTNKESMLPMLYQFIDLPYQQAYANSIRSSSLKKCDKLSMKERSMIDDLCMPVYKNLKNIATSL